MNWWRTTAIVAVLLACCSVAALFAQKPVGKPKTVTDLFSERFIKEHPSGTYEEMMEALVQDRIQQSAATVGPRFQIFFRTDIRADTFLVDTQTGRVWKPFTITDVKGQPSVWILQDRTDTDEEFSAWYSKQTPLSQEKK